MEFRQYKKHLHATLGVMIPAALILGIWLGSRAQSASLFETIAVLIVYTCLLIIVLPRVDRALLPPEDTH